MKGHQNGYSNMHWLTTNGSLWEWVCLRLMLILFVFNLLAYMEDQKAPYFLKGYGNMHHCIIKWGPSMLIEFMFKVLAYQRSQEVFFLEGAD